MSEKKKSPTGVRFNEEKTAFVMESESIKTRQQVLNFLLDRYWWEKKLGIKYEELPTNGRHEKQTETPKEEKKEPLKEEVKNPPKDYFKFLNEARMGTMDEAEMRKANLSANQIDLLIRKNNENKPQ